MGFLTSFEGRVARAGIKQQISAVGRKFAIAELNNIKYKADLYVTAVTTTIDLYKRKKKKEFKREYEPIGTKFDSLMYSIHRFTGTYNKTMKSEIRVIKEFSLSCQRTHTLFYNGDFGICEGARLPNTFRYYKYRTTQFYPAYNQMMAKYKNLQKLH